MYGSRFAIEQGKSDVGYECITTGRDGTTFIIKTGQVAYAGEVEPLRDHVELMKLF